MKASVLISAAREARLAVSEARKIKGFFQSKKDSPEILQLKKEIEAYKAKLAMVEEKISRARERLYLDGEDGVEDAISILSIGRAK